MYMLLPIYLKNSIGNVKYRFGVEYSYPTGIGTITTQLRVVDFETRGFCGGLPDRIDSVMCDSFAFWITRAAGETNGYASLSYTGSTNMYIFPEWNSENVWMMAYMSYSGPAIGTPAKPASDIVWYKIINKKIYYCYQSVTSTDRMVCMNDPTQEFTMSQMDGQTNIRLFKVINTITSSWEYVFDNSLQIDATILGFYMDADPTVTRVYIRWSDFSYFGAAQNVRMEKIRTYVTITDVESTPTPVPTDLEERVEALEKQMDKTISI